MVVLASLVAVAAAVSTPGSIDFDFQCAIATQQASEQVDSSLKADLSAGVTFYMGRADVRVPSSELESWFKRVVRDLEGVPLGPLVQQCGEFMQARGKAWEDIGRSLIAQEETNSRT